MSAIKFQTKLVKIADWPILRLPKAASEKLSSRGLAMVEGTANGILFQTALEPDGKGSHWFKVEKNLLNAINAQEGDIVKLSIEQSREWSEPEIPADLKKAVFASSKAQSTWKDITPFARWEWIRWVRGTKSEDTRKKRIGVAVSKLNSGMRRPCCFNSRECTIPYVSKGGVLLEAA